MPYNIKLHIKISKLKKIRISRGISQKQLSELSGIPVKCIGNYEQQRRDINKASAIIVYQLASALHCSMTDLMDL